MKMDLFSTNIQFFHWYIIHISMCKNSDAMETTITWDLDMHVMPTMCCVTTCCAGVYTYSNCTTYHEVGIHKENCTYTPPVQVIVQVQHASTKKAYIITLPNDITTTLDYST